MRNQEMEKRYSRIKINIKDNIEIISSMEKVNINGLIHLIIMDILIMESDKDMVNVIRITNNYIIKNKLIT